MGVGGVLCVMLGGKSALKSFISRPGFDICAEINGFFSRVSGLRTEIAGCIKTKSVCFAQSNASNKGFSCVEVWKSRNRMFAEKIGYVSEVYSFFLYFFTPVFKIII